MKKFEHTAPPHHIGRNMALGAATGLLLILFFVLGTDRTDPDWPKLWMVKPLITAPLAGSIGSLLYDMINPVRYQPGWKRTVANVAGLLAVLTSLWIGTVLGLDGTMWD